MTNELLLAFKKTEKELCIKKIFILLLLSISTHITSIYAQNLEVGGKVGVNLNSLKTNGYFDDNAEKTERLTRLQVSLNGEYALSSRFALDVALGYTGKGGGDFKEDDDLRLGIPDYNRKLEYLGLTTLFRFYVVKEGKVLPFVQIGPGFSYLLSATEMGNKLDDERLRSRFDISSNAGLGLKFVVGPKLRLELLGSWERGWSKTVRQENESLFNESFGIALGLKYVLQ